MKKVNKCKVKYMHMLDGSPAYYFPGEQIYFATWRRPIVLAESLKQIKAERKAALKWRAKQGFNSDKFNYGHFMVAV